MKKKTVTYYEATDGQEFDTEAKCLQYEADGCVKLEAIPKYADHLPINDPGARWMLSGDGSCYYATATKRSRIPAGRGTPPTWATHLIYFGK